MSKRKSFVHGPAHPILRSLHVHEPALFAMRRTVCPRDRASMQRTGLLMSVWVFWGRLLCLEPGGSIIDKSYVMHAHSVTPRAFSAPPRGDAGLACQPYLVALSAIWQVDNKALHTPVPRGSEGLMNGSRWTLTSPAGSALSTYGLGIFENGADVQVDVLVEIWWQF